MLAPSDVVLREDVGVCFADPDALLDPVEFAAPPFAKAFCIDSASSSTITEPRRLRCGLRCCLPPLGLLASAAGASLSAGLLLFLAAINGRRLHYLAGGLLDPELPALGNAFLHANPLLNNSFVLRDPKTYAWCVAYVLSALLCLCGVALPILAVTAFMRGSHLLSKTTRAVAIGMSLLGAVAALVSAVWLGGCYASRWANPGVWEQKFLRQFNYGTVLFAEKHVVLIRTSGTMAAISASASGLAARTTCGDTATGAAITTWAVFCASASAFLLLAGGIGALMPPLFAGPGIFLTWLLLLQLNFACCGRRAPCVALILFAGVFLHGCAAATTTMDLYVVVYSGKPQTPTILLELVRQHVALARWATALGGREGVALTAALAASQAVFALYAVVLFFWRLFGRRIKHKIKVMKAKFREKRAMRELKKRQHCHHLQHCERQEYLTAAAATTAVEPQIRIFPSQPVLIPPPPHTVLA